MRGRAGPGRARPHPPLLAVDGRGRASRSEHWYFALFSLLVGIATSGVGDIRLLLVDAVRPGESHINVVG